MLSKQEPGAAQEHREARRLTGVKHGRCEPAPRWLQK